MSKGNQKLIEIENKKDERISKRYLEMIKEINNSYKKAKINKFT